MIPNAIEDASLSNQPNALRDRVIRTDGLGPGFDMAAIERAESALAALSEDFRDWMWEEVERLQTASESFRLKPDSNDLRNSLFRSALDVRGQSETLGFPAAGVMAKGLCELLEGGVRKPGQLQNIVDLHVQAIRAVVRNEVHDLSDGATSALIAALADARRAAMPLPAEPDN